MSCHQGADVGLDCCIRLLISVSITASVCGGAYGCANGPGAWFTWKIFSVSVLKLSNALDEASNNHLPVVWDHLSFCLCFQTFGSLDYYRPFFSLKCRWGKKVSTNPIKIKLVYIMCVHNILCISWDGFIFKMTLIQAKISQLKPVNEL